MQNINEVKKPKNPALSGEVNAEIPDAESKSASPEVPAKNSNGDKKMNKLVTVEDIDVSDDISAIFEGSDLSEEFKSKARDIFETAMVAKINEQVELISEELEAEKDAEIVEIVEDLTDKVNEYLDYVVENWMEENKLSIETGLRTEMTEDFLQGLRQLFSEHFIDIPEEKIEVVEELAAKVQALEDSLSEEINKNVDLNQRVNFFEKEIAFAEVTEGMTETQTAKLESLSEAVDFSNAESFKDKLVTLRENYFPNEVINQREVTLDDEPIELSEEEEKSHKKLDPVMGNYVRAISRMTTKN